MHVFFCLFKLYISIFGFSAKRTCAIFLFIRSNKHTKINRKSEKEHYLQNFRSDLGFKGNTRTSAPLVKVNSTYMKHKF